MTSFYPAVTGRTSTPLAISRLLFQINSDQSSIQNLQTQLSTGRRIERPSQDPSAAIKALAAQRQQEFKKQADVNLKSADVVLSTTETSLAQAQTLLIEMRSVAVEAATNTLSRDQQLALTSQVENALARLTELANTKFGDQYLFAGSRVREAPVSFIGNAVRFSGNAEDLQTIADYSTTLAANVTANDAFGVKSSQVVGTVDLNPSISLDTQLSTLHRGDGVRTGAISISSGLEQVEIDLSDAHTISDVVERISGTSIGGRNLEVTLSSNGIDIAYQDGLGGLLRIGEVGGGKTAGDLGINNLSGAGASPVIGSDLDPTLTATTKLSQLHGGIGVGAGESLLIKQGEETYVVSTNGLNTFEDLVNRIEQSGAIVDAGIDPTGRFLTIQSTESGTKMSIGENGGNLATSLGIRSLTLETPVASLNDGLGIGANELGPDLVLTRSNGTDLEIDLDGVQNIGDVISRINNHVDNFTPALRIVASLATTGNGIVLTAANGAQPIAVRNAGGSQAANGLGFVPSGESSISGTTSGTNNVIAGQDVTGVEVEGVFTSLMRLRDVIQSGQPEQMESITNAIDNDLERLTLARSFVGTRQQSIGSQLDKSAEQQLQLTQIESDVLDADLASVISELSSREAALQASLKLMGQTSRLSLFDYL